MTSAAERDVTGGNATLELRVAERTDQGRRRRNNQDAMGQATSPDGVRLFIVADGIGGFKFGDVASRVAVDAACAVWEDAEGRLKDRLATAVEAANDAVNEEAMERGRLGNMGTTVAMLGIWGEEARVAYAGDSRVYRLRDAKIERLTVDHTDAQSLVTQGKIKPEEADTHKLRNLLTQYMGAAISVEPTISKALPIREDDTFLVCSDGLTATMKDPTIERVLRHAGPELAVDTLVDLANERGGPDNITVQVVRWSRHDGPLEELTRGSITEVPPGGLALSRVAPLLAAAAGFVGLVWWLVAS